MALKPLLKRLKQKLLSPDSVTTPEVYAVGGAPQETDHSSSEISARPTDEEVMQNAMLEKIFNRQRTFAYLGEHRGLTTTLYGHKIFLDTRDMTLVPHIIIDGMWESWVTDRVIHTLKPGMRALEVGSNMGWYTLLIAQQVGEQGKLTTFEANSHLAAMTLDSVCINGYLGRVSLHNLACSDRTGEATFFVRDRHLGNSSFGQVSQDLLDLLKDDQRQVTVKTVALDEFFSGEDRRVDFMKIDVEGAEPLVFKGMEQILKENPQIQIVMEYSPHQMRGVDADPADCMTFLFNLGFRARKIEPSGGLTEMDLAALAQIDHCDLLVSH